LARSPSLLPLLHHAHLVPFTQPLATHPRIAIEASSKSGLALIQTHFAALLLDLQVT
jgi:hypothetical protein